ncbi:hypothetical protein [Novosphingobium sp. ERN07]|uniref:hypothetical protein n=1 Tax=Novosphingobium sp. ERN07 TaxID=2726187 RepID=UPI001F11388E|nr:hypothetical protein [Novosphingobium sp. ERN07]
MSKSSSLIPPCARGIAPPEGNGWTTGIAVLDDVGDDTAALALPTGCGAVPDAAPAAEDEARGAALREGAGVRCVAGRDAAGGLSKPGGSSDS